MNKHIAIESMLQKLAKSASQSMATLGLTHLTRKRRIELTTRIKASPAQIRDAAAAAKAHPELFGNNVDPKEILADLAFVEEVEPAVAALQAFLRVVADEVLARKARAAQGAIAIKRI